MAPDLNSMHINGKWDYSTPGSTGYSVPKLVYNVCPWQIPLQDAITNKKLKDPSTRKLKVLTIGAGVSGILMAYQIQKYCDPANVEHVIYEKNADVGGTWLENRSVSLFIIQISALC